MIVLYFLLYYFLIAAICLLGATQVYSPVCTDTTDGMYCSIRSEPFLLKVFGNTVYVGVNNSIEVYDVLNLEHSSIATTASAERLAKCRNDLGFSRRQCHNFVFGIEEYSESELAVCGSNAYWPQCQLHRIDMLDYSRVLFSKEVNAAGYSAFGLQQPTPTTFIASNGYFFTVAQFALFGGRELLLRMAPNYRQGNLTFVVTTPWNALEFFHSPAAIFSIHEVGDRIYIYYTEQALDAVQVKPVIYSRVARVCKNDLGIEPRITDFSMLAIFRTFEKARITCQLPGSSFIYDTMLGTSIDTDLDGMPVVYATFNAPLDGPPGGIICKISFKSSQVLKVFADRAFTVQTSSESFSTEFVYRSVNCSGPQRSEDEARKFILHRSVVIAEPLISQQVLFLDKIVSEIIRHQEDVQEIIFFTNVRGDIKQLVRSGGISHIHTIYTAQAEQQVMHLVLHKYNGSRILIAATEGQIMQFNRGRCYCYIDCYTCLASKDPYCGWNTSIRACISKLAYSNDQILETYSASTQSIVNICGEQEIPIPVINSCPIQPFDSFVPQGIIKATPVPMSTIKRSNSSTERSSTRSTSTTTTTTTERNGANVRSNLNTITVTAISTTVGIVAAVILLTVGVLIKLIIKKRSKSVSKTTSRSNSVPKMTSISKSVPKMTSRSATKDKSRYDGIISRLPSDDIHDQAEDYDLYAL